MFSTSRNVRLLINIYPDTESGPQQEKASFYEVDMTMQRSTGAAQTAQEGYHTAQQSSTVIVNLRHHNWLGVTTYNLI